LRTPGSLLHIAPEYPFLRRLSEQRTLRYVTGDLDSPLASQRLDVTSLPFEAESFRFVMCNHVLEHVADDRRAMAELYRVLEPGGFAILMCPVDHERATTLEDPAVVSPHDRHRVFGQSDHVRLYGRDYCDRLAEAGFAVRDERYLDSLEPRSIRRLGLRRESDDVFGDEHIYVATKPDSGVAGEFSEGLARAS